MDVNDWLVEERVLRRESEGVSRFEVCETDRRSVAWYRETTTFSWQKPVLRTTTRRRVVTEHHNTITSPPICAKRLKQRVDPTRTAAAFRIPHMLEAKPPCPAPLPASTQRIPGHYNAHSACSCPDDTPQTLFQRVHPTTFQESGRAPPVLPVPCQDTI